MLKKLREFYSALDHKERALAIILHLVIILPPALFTIKHVIPYLVNQYKARNLEPFYSNRLEAEEVCMEDLRSNIPLVVQDGITSTSSFLRMYCRPSSTKTFGISRLYGYIVYKRITRSKYSLGNSRDIEIEDVLMHFGKPYKE